jgi:hypothetical protein
VAGSTSTYEGSCHCGTVRFRIEADLSQLTRCTAVHEERNAGLLRAGAAVPFTAGRERIDALSIHTCVAKHFFCRLHEPSVQSECFRCRCTLS